MSDHHKHTSRWINTYVVSEWCEKQQRYVTVEQEGYWYEGPMALAHDVPAIWLQEDFRWINDDGTLITGDPPTAGEASYRAAENVNPTDVQAGTELRLRFGFSETNSANGTGITNQTDGIRLQFENNTQNPGTWTTIGASGVTDVYYYDSQLTNGGAITNGDHILNYSGNEPVTDGEQVDDNQSDTADTHSNDHMEFEYSIGFSSGLASGDVINFRILAPDAQVVSTSASITLAAVTINESITFQTNTSANESVQAQYRPSVTFGANNYLIKNFSAGVFDNFYFGSPDKHIVDDVWKFVIGAVTGSVTFTTQQDQQTTIQLSGVASETFLLSLLQDQTNVKTTNSTVTLTVDLTQLEANQATMLKSMLYQIQEDITTLEIISTEETITMSVDLDMAQVNQMIGARSISLDSTLDFANTLQSDLVAAIQYITQLNYTVVGTTQAAIEEAITFAANHIYTPEVAGILRNTVTLINILTTAQQRQMVADKAVELLTDLQMQQQSTATIVTAINFLAQLDETATNTLDANKAVSLVLQAAEASNVNITFEETLLLTTQLLDAYAGTTGIASAITFDASLAQDQANLASKVSTITFSSILDELIDTQIDYTASIQLLASLATTYIGETAGNLEELITFGNILNQTHTPQAIYLESTQFATDLNKIVAVAKVVSETQTFSTELQQLQAKLLDKALAITFSSALDQINTGQVNFATLVAFAANFTDSYVGDASGALVGAVNFAIQMQKDQFGITLASKDISYDVALSEQGIAVKDLIEVLSLSVQLDQTEGYQRIVEDLAQFQVFVEKADASQVTYRPSMNFDLQAVELASTQKNALANILLNIDANMVNFGTTGIPGIITFASQQNMVTEIKLVAEGELVLNTELTESETYKLLGTRGITFGHLLGLSALSRTDFVELMSFGTITDVSINSQLLEFTIQTDEDRTIVIKFEDRTLKIFE